MTTAAETARERARQRTGQFGVQEHSDPEMTLGAREKTVEARELARNLLDEHGLSDWKVRIDNAQRRLGACFHSKKVISLSRQFIATGTDAQLRNTILHEIAHAHAGHGAGHGPAWKAAAARIGADPTRLSHAPEMRDVKARRLEDAIYASAHPFPRLGRIPDGTEVVITKGQRYLQGMRATILSRGTSRYLIETEDGQQFRAGSEFFGQAPD